MANYEEILNAISNYYANIETAGAAADPWNILANTSGVTATNAANVLENVPNVSVVLDDAGGVLNWGYGGEVNAFTAAEQTAANIANGVNSNAQIINEAALQIPGDIAVNGATITASSGAKAAVGGSTVATVLGHVATGLIGAGIGLKLGVWIDGALYNANPEFWDSHNLKELNPALWNSSVIGDLLLKNSGYDQFMTLLDNKGNVYVDERLFALYAKYLGLQGFFNIPQAQKDLLPESDFYNYETLPSPVNISPNVTIFHTRTYAVTDNQDEVSTCWNGGATMYWVSKAPFKLYTYEGVYSPNRVVAKNGNDMYVFQIYDGYFVQYANDTNAIPNTFPAGYNENDLYYLLAYGFNPETAIPTGVNQYETLPAPQITPQTDLDSLLQALRQQYPDIWLRQINQGVLNKDGTETERHYVPVPMPSGGTETQPQTKPQDAPAPSPSTDPNPDPQQKTRTEESTKPSDPSKPTDTDTGTGITPPVVIPTGTASALYKIYNPTDAQVQSFGAWLWSPNFVDQILKMFNDPMQAIISLHKIYVSPHVGGSTNIKVGYLDSGVAANYVDQQYVTVDCGTVKLNETYGNAVDYASFVNIYLPFVGIVPLNTADVMRGTIGVKYHVDVITGALLVDVSIKRDGESGGILYQYTGSCSEQYPLSSGSYMGIVTGILGIAAGIAGTVATGGAAAPMLLGAGAAASGMRANIQRTNGFSGNSGAMGCKKPYLIVEKPITARANNDAHMIGYPSNQYATVSSLRGFIKAKSIFTNNINRATDAEKARIKSLFMEGVII